MELMLEGKKALITGGSKGIGKAIAESLSKEKVKVAIVARGKDDIDKTVEEIGGGKEGHIGFSIDLLDESGPISLYEELQSDFGMPEIVVHNLGGSLAIRDPLCSINEWRKVWRLNMEIPIEMNNLLIPTMERNNWGRLVHISSVSGLENLGPIPYCSTKAALTAYSRSLGRVLASKGIAVSAVLPGAVYSIDGPWGKRAKDEPEEVEKYLREQTPMKKFSKPEEISSLVTFLCSPLASQCASSVFPIDGGLGRSFIQ
jgi:3-oxoacyl-[acyl-carrier protein] reductase